MDLSFKMEGLEGFNKLVDGLPEAFRQQVYPLAMSKAASALRAKFVQAMPQKTGMTKRSFGVFKKKTTDKLSSVYGVGPYRKTENKKQTQSQSARGGLKKVKRFMVVGWFERGTIKQPPRPFMNRVAQEFYGGEATLIIGRSLTRALAQVAKKSAKAGLGGGRKRGRR